MLDMVAPGMAIFHSVWSLPAMTALLAGLLCLDESAAVQTWFSQPLPASILTGLIWGRPEMGLLVGIPMQMILMGNLPVGQSFVGDPVTAVVGMTAAACAVGPGAATFAGGAPSDQWGLWGWLLLGTGLLSFAGHWLVRAERRAFGLWMHEGRSSLRDGSLGRMERLHLRCMMVTFLRGATFAVIFLILAQVFWIPLYGRVGGSVRRGLAMLPVLLPGMGVGALVEQFGWHRCWRWGVLGAGLALLVWGRSWL